MPDRIKDLKQRCISPPAGSVLAGFDGYIDKVVKLKKSQSGPALFFDSIGELVRHIERHQNQSLDISLKKITEKPGGNGPLLAESLAYKKIKTCCIGAFGYPKIHPVFEPLSKRCELVSLEDPASALAIEFQDGKIMLGDNEPLDKIGWERLRTFPGEEALFKKIHDSTIMAFTNWSGLSQSNDILESLLRHICPKLADRKLLLFDLADPVCKSSDQFREFFSLVDKLSFYFDIILSLNAKEALVVYNRLFDLNESVFDASMLSKMIQGLSCAEIVIHNAEWALAANKEKTFKKIKGKAITEPAILTGAGDNFNAGYCLGKLWSLDPGLCAWLGYLGARWYVQNGIPVTLEEIITLMDSVPYNEEEE